MHECQSPLNVFFGTLLSLQRFIDMGTISLQTLIVYLVIGAVLHWLEDL